MRKKKMKIRGAFTGTVRWGGGDPLPPSRQGEGLPRPEVRRVIRTKKDVEKS
jgi:hypothetical protein